MRCDAVIYDVLVKPKHQPYKATPEADKKYTKDGRLYANQRAEDETLDAFRARLVEAIQEEPDRFYQQIEVVRLDGQRNEIEEWQGDVWAVAANIRDAQNSGRWPRNPDACFSYGQLCPFWGPCIGVADLNDPSQFRKLESVHQELNGADAKVLSSSRIKTFRSCARKHQYRYELGYDSVGEKAALTFGTAIHAALEAWWKAVQERVPMVEWLARALEALPELDEVARVRAEVMVVGYHHRWAGWAETVEVVQVEGEFNLPLLNPATGRASKTWRLGGKMDCVIRDQGRLLVLEHKTSSESVDPGSVYRSRLTMDNQASQYHYAASQMNKGTDAGQA